jgi:hypothetical protein
LEAWDQLNGDEKILVLLSYRKKNGKRKRLGILL